MSGRGLPFKSVSVRTVSQIALKLDDSGNTLEVYSGIEGALGAGAGGGAGVGVAVAGVGVLLLPPPPQAARNAQLATETISSLIEFVIPFP